MSDSPRIYVACLASYNAGRLHGEWIDVSDPDTMSAEIQEVLNTSPEAYAEEWAVHDYDDCPDLGEYPSLALLCQTVELISEYGDGARLLIENLGGDVEAAASELADGKYLGSWESAHAWADEYLEDMGAFAEMGTWAQYFDVDRFLRDCECGDFTFIRSGGVVHVFLG